MYNDDAASRLASNSDFESGTGSEDSESTTQTPDIPTPPESEPHSVVRSPPAEDDGTQADQAEDDTVIHARAYQVEMFEESLKRNIIVAMDTGTGKTQVAILRIKAELERAAPEKLVWFLAPTAALCVQQCGVIEKQVRGIQVKRLIGADNCHTWSEPRIWDDFLRNVRIVVSTHQVLYDAISHAFLRLSRLSLLVFDEAHHCVGGHPGSKIMTRYHEEKYAGFPVPAILGLTASPIMRSKLKGLEEIERTLDAICRSPNLHRAQLMSMVKQPQLSYLLHEPRQFAPAFYTQSVDSLIGTIRSLDILDDPYVIRLRREGSERSRALLKKALEKEDTKTMKQLKAFYRKCIELWHELGGWAADYFIFTAINQFLQSARKNDAWFGMWEGAEKQYLATVLQKVEVRDRPADDAPKISHKMNILVQELLASPEDTKGIIFVRQTATVAVLAHILSVLPSTKSRFRVGSMVGTSRNGMWKRNVGDLYREDDYYHLDEFRADKIDLLVATSVLEEGIDVPACNLVICFDEPENLRSFIQRRGRARQQESRLVIIADRESGRHAEWAQLEIEMKRKCEDNLREVERLAALEDEDAEVPPFRIAKTGAQLDFDQAKSHLQHVCAALSYRQYMESQLYYLTQETVVSQNKPPIVKATVVLPLSFPPHLRRFEGSRSWLSEKNATKDAAFQAFVALHGAGLVNDYLMPLIEELQGVEARPAKFEVSEQWNPWLAIAHSWAESDNDSANSRSIDTDISMRQLKLIDQHGKVITKFNAALPGVDSLPDIPQFDIYLDKDNGWKIEVGEHQAMKRSSLGPDQSMALLGLAYGHRWPVQHDRSHVLHLLSPTSEDLRPGHVAGKQHPLEEGAIPDNSFLIRDYKNVPFFFESWLPSRPSLDKVRNRLLSELLEEDLVEQPWLTLRKWPRRQDFLHPAHQDVVASIVARSTKPYCSARPASLCTVDPTAPMSAVRFGALIPSIMHVLEIYMVAAELRRTVLRESPIEDLSLVVTAISASVARESTNYQRLEFLGDSILKLLTSVNLAANNPYYPEGYLSVMESRIVSNSRLCRAAVETGLDKFILTKPFTGAKWRPRYIDDLLKLDPSELGKRVISTKTLADVVESLIGASYLDGGIDRALTCIRLFIPDIEWHPLDTARSILAAQKPMRRGLPSTLEPLEALLGYTFQNKALAVEAMTHSSFSAGELRAGETCMERLEFIGDAVLDNVVVSYLWDCGRELGHYRMHLLRAACVNADLLGFLVMEWAYEEAATRIADDGAKTTLETSLRVPAWRLMRHNSSSLSEAQTLAEQNHTANRDAILAAMCEDPVYPWAALAQLEIPKSFSDLFEAILGAVWLDSSSSSSPDSDAGPMDICRRVAERVGILPYLRRMVADDVVAAHPKNRLGELAGTMGRKVIYEAERRRRRADGDADGEGARAEWVCRVFLADELVVEVGGGVNKEEVVTKAANAALQKLSGKNGVANADAGTHADAVAIEDDVAMT